MSFQKTFKLVETNKSGVLRYSKQEVPSAKYSQTGANHACRYGQWAEQQSAAVQASKNTTGELRVQV